VSHSRYVSNKHKKKEAKLVFPVVYSGIILLNFMREFNKDLICAFYLPSLPHTGDCEVQQDDLIAIQGVRCSHRVSTKQRAV
jgi:hypothetical protein